MIFHREDNRLQVLAEDFKTTGEETSKKECTKR